MKATRIIYYIITVLFSASILMGAYFELSGNPTAMESMKHLGYPVYFNTILGTAKILGVLALLQSFMPTLKEWAYAGFVFNLTGAVVSVLANGDPFTESLPAFINLLFLITSYILYKKIKANSEKVTVIKA